MNNHLLPAPYNQTESPSWLEKALIRPLCAAFLGSTPRVTPQQPSTTSPILLNTDQDGSRHGHDHPISVVCISDTHNATPPLPPGDILIHAGDLTTNGTFDELQAQLTWLSAQPHQHKIVIAGNHDLILDENCDGKFLTRGEEDSAIKRHKIDWNGLGIRYLQDEADTLTIGAGPNARKVRIYGSPSTPEFDRWAFQYPAIRNVWAGAVVEDTDILVVHGPPALYGDCDGEIDSAGSFKVKGDGYLLREIRRRQPRLVVCGHIHGAYGVARIGLDGLSELRDAQMMGWAGYGLFRVLGVLWEKGVVKNDSRQTLVVNAAHASSGQSTQEKDPIVVEM